MKKNSFTMTLHTSILITIITNRNAAIAALFLLFLTSCVGIGVFHKTKAICKYEEVPNLTLAERVNNKLSSDKSDSLKVTCAKGSYPWYVSKIIKEDITKRWGVPERIEKLSDNEEKLVYKKDLAWSAVNIMIGVPIPIGIPTSRKYKSFYLRDNLLFKTEEDYSELYGAWCGVSWTFNDKTKRIDLFGCAAKFK